MAVINIPKLPSPKIAYLGDLFSVSLRSKITLHQNDCGQTMDQYEGLDWAWNNAGVHQWRGKNSRQYSRYSVEAWEKQNPNYIAFITDK